MKSRPQRPLDALILTLPLDALNGDDVTRASLLNNCQQIQQVCGLSLPVYLLISGMESLEGTAALLAILPEDARRSPIGSAIPTAREAIWKPQWIDDALDNARMSLRRLITELGALQGSTPETLFQLPENLPQLATPLHDYFDTLFNSNARDEPPLLRGIWFVARTMAEGKPQMQFCQTLLSGKIAAERGLALPVRRLLRLNLRRHFITLACYSCLYVLWLAAMTGAGDTSTPMPYYCTIVCRFSPQASEPILLVSVLPHCTGGYSTVFHSGSFVPSSGRLAVQPHR